MRTILRKLCFVLFILFAIRIVVEGRRLNSITIDNELVSDGVDDDDEVQHNKTYLLSKGIESEPIYQECKQMYGFLPCSNNIFGHLFLILVYEYLLFHGESYLADGGQQIFKILGPGIFGASAFHILSALPESLILLVSGLLSSKEIAQEYAFTGVGLLAGSSILLLTVVWGTCVIIGAQQFNRDLNLRNFDDSNSASTRLETFLTGHGITTDLETSYTARIMIFSVIPLIIMQIPSLFQFSSGPRSVTLIIALIITAIFLLLYFTYQIFEPWIQKRRLEYVKRNHLLVQILRHVEKSTLERILTKHGSPNVSAIRRLFREMDQDGDSVVTPSEVKQILLKSKSNERSINEMEIEDMMRVFDLNADDNRITKDEFVSGFIKWLEQTKFALNKQYMSRKSLKELYQVFEPWIENKRREQETKRYVISEILWHIQNDLVINLLTEDGKPDELAIRGLFDKIDSNKDNCISGSELRKLLTDINVAKSSIDVEEAASKFIEELDSDSDHVISEEEFISGLKKWLSSSSPSPALLSDSESQEDMVKMWEETNMVVEENQSKAVVDKSVWAWLKAIMYVVVGIAILSGLAEPLVESVRKFSDSAGINAFFISFILVPLATNAKIAISAIKEASHQKSRTTSLSISEIYGGVFMNNVLGFFAISVLIYARGITWEFSAEALVVALVCLVAGLAASFNSSFPIWSSFCAYLLYPFSLVLVFILRDVLTYI
ncbi:sodium/calcium exchanger NCL2-like [Prosopis cineraria]|uniref:sodium/calcium exchanger NCL2-like n=1 Tax=Prosopis cineraria TaxID=364024 RepID=UPI00240FE7A3|nr:sodium/calcium exchanger NCL2-like [Prosopis cineraria]